MLHFGGNVRAARVGVVLLGLLGACDGAVGPGMGPAGPGGSGGAAGSDGGGSGSALDPILHDTPGGVELRCEEEAGELAEGPLLKLSTRQYRNTVRDLLDRYGLGAVTEQVEGLLEAVPGDSLREGFRSLDDRVALEHVQAYFDVGVTVGDALLDSPELLTLAAGSCASETPLSDACWEAFLSDFVQRVHRRPLLDSERQVYDALRDSAATGPQAVRAAVVVGMSSPRFVYHVETDGTAVAGDERVLRLDAFEVANRLSYTFWQTSPDEELWAAAQDGTLLNEEVYARQLERVWQDPRTQNTLRQFWTEWLKLESFTGFETTRPAFQSLAQGEHIGEPGHDYYGDMVEEVHDLVDLFTFELDGTLADLLSTRISVTQSADLASLYGVEPWDGSGEYPRFTEGERAGLLQRAALLVSNLEQTNPFHRGAMVRMHFLCDPLAAPDPNALPPGSLDTPPVDGAMTTRERFQQKVEGNPLCAGCHNTFSNIGYVMESFDALGRFRTVEQVFDEETGELLAELPIDTEAQARIAEANEAPVRSATEMNQLIVDSGKVEACLAQKYFAYVSRRAMKSASLDRCVVDDMQQQLSNREGGLAAAFRRLALTPTFFTRGVGAP